jgi:hypothetical protein
MDLRQTPRVPTEKVVKLVVLGDPEIVAQATVRDASEKGLGLVSTKPAPVGSAVQIEFEDSIFLGESIHCKETAEGFLVGIELKEVLSGVAALARMAERFSSETEPSVTPAVK